MVSLHNAVDITNDPYHEGLGLEAWESEYFWHLHIVLLYIYIT